MNQRVSVRQLNRTVLRRLTQVITQRPAVTSDANPDMVGSPASPLHSFYGNQGMLHVMTSPPQGRTAELEYYDYLEEEIPDARRALDAYATMAVTGNLAGGGSDTYRIKLLGDEDSYPDALKRRLRHCEDLMKATAYPFIREMCKSGTFAPQIVLGERRDGRTGIIQLKPLPPATMFKKVDANGNMDPENYWEQKTKRGTVTAPRWMIPEFSIWANVVKPYETLIYGTGLLKPFGAIGLKVHSSLDALVIARLTRSAARYKWIHDVSDLLKDKEQGGANKAIMKRIQEWSRSIGRQMVSEGFGKSSFGKVTPPEQDFHIPGAHNMAWDVQLLSGDTNVGQVKDVELMFKVYFGALGVPPEYIGHERSHGGRSNLSQIDIHFARATRHIQMFGASGYEHMVCVDMLAGGYDPHDYPIEVIPPKIGARDDLLQAQIRDMQSQVIQRLAEAGFNLAANPRWVLSTFFNLNEELEMLTTEDLARLLPERTDNEGEAGGGGNDDPAPSEEVVSRISSDLSKKNADLIDQVRNNIMVMAIAGDQQNIHRYGVPSVAALYDGMQRGGINVRFK